MAMSVMSLSVVSSSLRAAFSRTFWTSLPGEMPKTWVKVRLNVVGESPAVAASEPIESSSA